VLDEKLRIISANQSFYHVFCVSPMKPRKTHLRNFQWSVGIPKLRELLENVLSESTDLYSFEIDIEFPVWPPHNVLNARPLHNDGKKNARILLAIVDVTEHKELEHKMISSELRYRRLFKQPRWILILDALNGEITDINPFLINMLGYSKEEC